MIARLRGTVIERNATTLVVDVRGVGYEVTVSAHCEARVGEEVDLHVHTHVRESVFQLFGFADSLEREVFHLLLAVPSIGPVKAMGILASPAEDVIELVKRREPARLAKLPGVGKKTAERIILDLAEKFAALKFSAKGAGVVPAGAGLSASLGQADDLTSALVNLGFRPAAAEVAARQAIEQLGAEAKLAPLLRQALSHATRP